MDMTNWFINCPTRFYATLNELKETKKFRDQP